MSDTAILTLSLIHILDAIEACGWALKGPTATPIGKGFRSINVQLRQRFSTYANLRPVHTPVSYTHLDVYKRQEMGCP